MLNHYADFEHLLAPIQLVLFMLGMGAMLSLNAFVAVARRPRFLVVGVVCQFMLTPLLAVLLNDWWDLEAGVAIGLILMSAMPGGQMSKLFTYLARGNVALSISLTACGTFGSLVTVPLLLHWLAGEHLRASNFTMPVGRVVLDMALYLVMPLLVGALVGRFAPARRAVFSRVCIRIGLVFVAVMVVGSIASGRIQPAAYGWRVPLAIILFCVVSQQLSLLPFRVLGWSRRDGVAIGIEVTMRNMNLALLLWELLFPRAEDVATQAVANGVLFVVLYYGGTALIVGMPLALRYRRLLRGEPGALAHEEPT